MWVCFRGGALFRFVLEAAHHICHLQRNYMNLLQLKKHPNGQTVQFFIMNRANICSSYFCITMVLWRAIIILINTFQFNVCSLPTIF